MLDTLFASVTGDTLTPATMLQSLGMALLLGALISGLYYKTHRGAERQRGFMITLVMLPAIISVIIMLIGNNVARAFSLAGAFSLIRFRSAPGDPQDIAYVFFALAAGLGCGMGYLAYAVVFTVIMCLMMLALDRIGSGRRRSAYMQLRITVPEDLNFQGLFDDILSEYTNSWTMQKIKTSDFGTLFEISYSIDLKRPDEQKQFIDELRCRNGNMNISLTRRETEDRLPA